MTRQEASNLEPGDQVFIRGNKRILTIEVISDMGDNIGVWLDNGAFEIHKNIECVVRS